MSSQNTVCYGKSKDKKSSNSKNSALRKIPNHPTYNMDRYIGRSEHVVNPHQHQPRNSETRNSDNAEVEKRTIAARQARAYAILQAFETQFSHSSKPPPKQ